MSDTHLIYFQFPLCVLAFGSDPEDRLRSVISYCVVSRAQKAFPTTRELKEFNKRLSPAQRPPGYDTSAQLVAAGCSLLRVTNLSSDFAFQSFNKISAFVSESEHLGTSRALVRIRTDLMWAAVEGRMRYREFAVLAAVYSVLGANKYPVRITRETIIARSLGYSAPVFRARRDELLSARADGAEPLTLDQMRWTLDRLEERHLFARTHIPKSRVTLFSHRLAADELRKAAVGWRIQREEVKRNRAADREAWAKVKHPAKRKRQSPETPHLNSAEIPELPLKTDLEQSPGSPQVVPRLSPQTPHGTPHLNTNLKETLIEPSTVEPLPQAERASARARDPQNSGFNGLGRYEPDPVQGQNPEPTPPPERPLPTAAEVEQFAGALGERLFPGAGKLALEWHQRFGTNEQWRLKDWRRPMSSWIADQITREKQRSALL